MGMIGDFTEFGSLGTANGLRWWVAIFSCASVIFSLQNSPLADADVNPAQSYENEKAKFLYASYEAKDFNNRETVRYTVCNKHDKRPLLFVWRLAGFASGPDCPLMIDHCAIHERDVLGSVKRDTTTIEFIQDAPGHHDTSAFLPQTNGDSNAMDNISGFFTQFFGYFGGRPQCAESIAKVIVWADFLEDKKEVLLDFFWNPPRISVAFGIDKEKYSNAQIGTILKTVQEFDPDASLKSESSILSDNDKKWLGEKFRRSYYLTFSLKNKTDQRVRIFYSASDFEVNEAPLIFLRDGKVQFAMMATSLQPNNKQ